MMFIAAIDAVFIDLATLLGFVVVGFGAFTVFNMLLGGRAKAVTSEGVDVPIPGMKKAGPLKRAFAGAIPQFTSDVESIRRDLIRAGHYEASALEDYLAARNICTLLLLFGLGGLAVIANPNGPWPVRLMIAAVISSLLCYSLPRLTLARQAKDRVARIERGLPDALDIIQMCLTGGLPLSESFARVADEIRYTHPDIAIEFEIIRRQADAGSMAKALRNFADRIDAPDIRALAALVTQNERMGTEVSVAIGEFGDRMRLSYRQRAEERASKAGVKLLFPVIFCLVPPILIAIAGPPILKLRNFLIEANQPGGVLNPSTNQEGDASNQGQNAAGNQ
ncbi:MAG: type II secretion system F family protein [Planctomycetaceae bacterium]